MFVKNDRAVMTSPVEESSRGDAVTGRDLRALFGSNDQGVDADKVFTNRQAQWSALTSALAAHLAHVTVASFDVEDLEAPRTNVLVFHGVGGIGKTTLSRRIESALTSGEHRPAQWSEPAFSEQVLPLRIDLARSAGMDFERVVLAIRYRATCPARPPRTKSIAPKPSTSVTSANALSPKPTEPGRWHSPTLASPTTNSTSRDGF
ncbi:hypothetical protein ACIPX0_03485 [Streptomyces sp. NPDC090075]|uniref:hypothetical protein n=1 Tax=Streptomyces sp. NPDC090075 TaxID=3365937 RepID=UPI003803D7F5